MKTRLNAQGRIGRLTIPTVSHWGLIVMSLLLLVGGKVYFNRRRSAGE